VPLIGRASRVPSGDTFRNLSGEQQAISKLPVAMKAENGDGLLFLNKAYSVLLAPRKGTVFVKVKHA